MSSTSTDQPRGEPGETQQPPLVLSTKDQLPERLETERLVIRVAKPGDGAMFNEAIVESLDTLNPWLGWVTPTPTLEQSEFGCRKAYARFLLNEDLMVFFFLKSDGTLIGGSGLHDVDWALRRFEIGYWGRARFGGRGLMTEGVRAIADYALRDLSANRVFLTTDAENVASWRLAERAGFILEGTLRNERFNLSGRLRDTRMYSKTTEAVQLAGKESNGICRVIDAARSPLPDQKG